MSINENMSTWNELTSILSNYLEENKSKNTPVVEYQSAVNLEKLLGLELNQEKSDSSVVLDEIKKIPKI